MEKDDMEIKLSKSATSVVPNMEKGIEDNTQRTYSHPSKGTNRKTKRSESLITLNKIKKHYGKPMDETATILKVSRSTLKRICRKLGIPRWPYRNGHDKSESLMKSDPADVVHMSERALTLVFVTSIEQLGIDPVTLTKNGEQTNLSGETKATKMMAKVTYDKSIIKFPFSLLDGGLVKLNEMVATRFQLRLGSFRLKCVDKDGNNISIANDNELAAILDAWH